MSHYSKAKLPPSSFAMATHSNPPARRRRILKHQRLGTSSASPGRRRSTCGLLMSFPAALCLLILLQDLCFRRMASAAARGATARHSGYDRCVLSVAPRCGSSSCTCPSQPCGVWLAESVRVLATVSDSASAVVLTRLKCFISWAKRSASRGPLEAHPLALSC